MPTLSQNRDLPAAITQLKLCYALRFCGPLGVVGAFDKNDDENLYVYDDDALGYSDWTNVEPTAFLSKTFHAQNPNRNTLVLLPLDGRIITGDHFIRGGICDCALLTDKELSFIEFKTNVSSDLDKTILEHAEKAVDQLWHTYDSIINPECRRVGIDITLNVSIDFYVVFDSVLGVTGARADIQNLQNEFLQEKHYPLYYQNNKQFA